MRNERLCTVFEDWEKYPVNAIGIDLAEPLPPEESIRLTVSSEGRLVGYTEVGLHSVRDPVGCDFTILREEPLAFPSSDSTRNFSISR